MGAAGTLGPRFDLERKALDFQHQKKKKKKNQKRLEGGAKGLRPRCCVPSLRAGGVFWSKDGAYNREHAKMGIPPMGGFRLASGTWYGRSDGRAETDQRGLR